jgi:hypothetical protein
MHRLRIFISHSNKDQEALSFVEQLYQALTDKNFDTLVDRKRLEPGATWRDEIYTWMGLSHAAIVLLSEDVFKPNSLWVPRESSILLWRHAIDPDFIVIPVFLGNVTEANLSTGNFKDLLFSEIEAPVKGPPLQVIQDILKVLARLQTTASTPLEELSRQIAHLLRHLEKEIIDAAAQLLGVDLGAWDPADDPRKSFALKLLQVDLIQATAALEYLVEYMDTQELADRILSMIAPSWVDPCAARWIPDCYRVKTNKPLVVLNAARKITADMYVQRACCRSPKTMWPVIPISGVYGESSREEIVREIKEMLQRHFRLEQDVYEEDFDKRLLEVMALRETHGKPVFVVLRPDHQIRPHLSYLREQLPYVTFFALTGDAPIAAELGGLTPARVLEPLLQPGEEEKALNRYQYAVSVIRPTV